MIKIFIAVAFILFSHAVASNKWVQSNEYKSFIESGVESEHQQAIQKALATLTGPSTEVRVTPLRGGHSRDPLYRITFGSKEYVFRIPLQGYDIFAACTQLASNHGFGPRLVYADKETSSLLIEFIQGSPLGAKHLENPETIQQLADHLKTMHQSSQQLPTFDSFKRLHLRLEMNQSDYSELNLDLISQKIEAVEKLIAWCHFSQVLSHNDLHSGNLFYDPHGKIKFIDWGDAGLCDPFVDLARISFEFNFSAEQNSIFLNQYFGRAPEAIETSRFYLMRQMALARCGFSFLNRGGNVDDSVVQELKLSIQQGNLNIVQELKLSAQ